MLPKIEARPCKSKKQDTCLTNCMTTCYPHASSAWHLLCNKFWSGHLYELQLKCNLMPTLRQIDSIPCVLIFIGACFYLPSWSTESASHALLCVLQRLPKHKLKLPGTVKEIEPLKNPCPPGSHSCHGTLQMQMWYRIAKSPVLKLELARHRTDALLAFQSFRPRMQHESYCPLQSRNTKPCSLGSQERLKLPFNIAEWKITLSLDSSQTGPLHMVQRRPTFGETAISDWLQFKDKQWK